MGGSTLARRTARRSLSILATMGLLAGLLTAGSSAVSAAVICGSDCGPSISTPLGSANVTVSATHVVTVVFSPNDPVHTFVAGVPFAMPPGPPNFGFVRSSLVTAGGTVNIDTVAMPPGPPTLPGLTYTSLAVISIHPPNPCRLTLTRSATSTIVVFTPIF